MANNTGKVSTPYPTVITMKENGKKEKLKVWELPNILMVPHMKEIL